MINSSAPASLALLLLVAIFGHASGSFGDHGLFWGGSAGSTANIARTGEWVDIDEAEIAVNLQKGSTALITYHLTVEAVKGIGAKLLPSENNKDTLQVRATVDGVPYRSSGSVASTYLVAQRTFSELSCSFTAQMSGNNHTVQLQWKKLGTQVDRWTIAPPALGSGYAISVMADHSQIFELEEPLTSSCSTGEWVDATNKLEFTLAADADLILGYSMTAASLVSFLKDDKEYVSSHGYRWCCFH